MKSAFDLLKEVLTIITSAKRFLDPLDVEVGVSGELDEFIVFVKDDGLVCGNRLEVCLLLPLSDQNSTRIPLRHRKKDKKDSTPMIVSKLA